MAQKKKVSAVITAQKEIAPDIFDMWMQTELAKEAKAGQFIAVYPKNESTLLPRPISICEVDEKGEKLRIVYRIAGKGTREFSAYKEGEKAAILGILGNGFPIERELSTEGEFSMERETSTERKQIFLMGGGIGIPPMLELAKELSACAGQNNSQSPELRIILGYRDANLFLKEDLEKYGEVYIATEDGSAGTKGNVMDAIRENNLHADAPCNQNLCKGTEDKGIYFTGGKNGLRRRRLPWLCMQDKECGSSFSCKECKDLYRRACI